MMLPSIGYTSPNSLLGPLPNLFPFSNIATLLERFELAANDRYRNMVPLRLFVDHLKASAAAENERLGLRDI